MSNPEEDGDGSEAEEYVDLPEEVQHWFLAVVCFPGLTGENINTNTVTRVSNESTEKSIPQSKKKDKDIQILILMEVVLRSLNQVESINIVAR
uniref:Uncharacterized protein n=2 Tax=Timema TaxID=61471 RepID=A0A7R9IHG4_9NEOP|nr:unnamed protein product [Timema bartmani]CAD7458262.1 unnamed protein product [Timema tahoe]